MKKKRLFIALLSLALGYSCAAQGLVDDTLAFFDFNSPTPTVATGTGTGHQLTAYATTWHRMAGTSYLFSDEFAAYYPTYGSVMANTLAQYMDSAFMLMSMWDFTETGLHYDAWFELGEVDASQASIVEVRMRQIYRKYYDSCWVDYTDAAGAWHTIQINVTGVDASINSYGSLDYSFTLPADAAGNATLKVRFRWTNRDGNIAAGYLWAIDNVAICRGQTNRLEQYANNYTQGAYGTIPQGMVLPLSWNTQVKNSGAVTQTGVRARMLMYDGNDTDFANPDVYLSVAQPDIPADQVLYTLAIDNYAAGLPTGQAGDYYYVMQVLTDSLTISNDSPHRYRVSTADADSTRVWAHDKGIITSTAAYRYGYIFNETYGSWFTTDDSPNAGSNGYRMLNLYQTGNSIPVGADGSNWVIRGVEIVPAVTADASQYQGAVLKPFLCYLDENYSIHSYATGTTNYTVQASDYNPAISESGYNTIRLLFPNEVMLEPNQTYCIGYELEGDHDFAAAAAGSNLSGSHTLVLDPVRNQWVYPNTTNRPMIRLLVGPGTNAPKYWVQDFLNHGYIDFTPTQVGTTSYIELSQGSHVKAWIMPSDGYRVDTSYLDLTGVDSVYYDGEHWTIVINSLNGNVEINGNCPRIPACFQTLPYAIGSTDNWIEGCWTTFNTADSNRAYFSNEIRSPQFQLGNTDHVTVSFTLDNTATTATSVTLSLYDKTNGGTLCTYTRPVAAGQAGQTITHTFQNPQMAGKAVQFGIYFQEQSSYLMSLTDFSISADPSPLTVTPTGNQMLFVGDTLTVTAEATNGTWPDEYSVIFSYYNPSTGQYLDAVRGGAVSSFAWPATGGYSVRVFASWADGTTFSTSFTVNVLDSALANDTVRLPYAADAAHGDFSRWTLEGGAQLTADGRISLTAPGQTAYSPWFYLADDGTELQYRPLITRNTISDNDGWEWYDDYIWMQTGIEINGMGWSPLYNDYLYSNKVNNGRSLDATYNGLLARYKVAYLDGSTSSDTLYVKHLTLFQYGLYGTLLLPDSIVAGQPANLGVDVFTSDGATEDTSVSWYYISDDGEIYMGDGAYISYTWDTPGTYDGFVYLNRAFVFDGWDAGQFINFTVTVLPGETTPDTTQGSETDHLFAVTNTGGGYMYINNEQQVTGTQYFDDSTITVMLASIAPNSPYHSVVSDSSDRLVALYVNGQSVALDGSDPRLAFNDWTDDRYYFYILTLSATNTMQTVEAVFAPWLSDNSNCHNINGLTVQTGDTWATLNWMPPASSNGNYLINNIPVNNNTDCSYQLSGLQPNTTHTIPFRTYCLNGNYVDTTITLTTYGTPVSFTLTNHGGGDATIPDADGYFYLGNGLYSSDSTFTVSGYEGRSFNLIFVDFSAESATTYGIDTAARLLRRLVVDGVEIDINNMSTNYSLETDGFQLHWMILTYGQVNNVVATFVEPNPEDSLVVIGDTIYRDTVIYNITYQDSIEYNITTVDSTVYHYDTTLVAVYDTVHTNVNVYDTVHTNVNVYDTVHTNVTVYDTVPVTVHDTTHVSVTIYDTTHVEVVDTTLVPIVYHDTIYIYDTVYVGVDEVVTTNARIYTSGSRIVVEGAEDHPVHVYDVTGRLLATKRDDHSSNALYFDTPASGAYLVKVGPFPARRVIVVR